MVRQLILESIFVGSIPISDDKTTGGTEGYLYPPFFLKNKETIMETKLPPKNKYPKILWYIIKKIPPTPQEKRIIYNRNYKNILNKMIIELPPTTDHGELEFIADDRAAKMTEDECTRPTDIRKIVIESKKTEENMMYVIENSKIFIRWVDNS